MRTPEEQIQAILKMGRRPVITLSPGMQMIPPKLPRRGRPRVRHPHRACAHYADIRTGGRRQHPPPSQNQRETRVALARASVLRTIPETRRPIAARMSFRTPDRAVNSRVS